MKLLALSLFFLGSCFGQRDHGGTAITRQVSSGNNSPNISRVNGNVTITYTSTSTCTVESSTSTVYGGPTNSMIGGLPFVRSDRHLTDSQEIGFHGVGGDYRPLLNSGVLITAESSNL